MPSNSPAYRLPRGTLPLVAKLAKGIEEIGYDQLDVYDHVVMGFDIEGRTKSYYPAQMPVIEAFMMLSYAAAVTERIGLGTEEVLVLPQRQPALVAKQVSSLDTLSDGRVRLGIGVGWQESEYEALGENFKDRGRRMDEAIELLRTYWRDERVDFASELLSDRGDGDGAAITLRAADCRSGLAVIQPRRSGGWADTAMAGSRARSATRISPSGPWTPLRAAAVAAGRDPGGDRLAKHDRATHRVGVTLP